MIEKVESSKAPKAIGPYSQAITANGMMFISGQLPLDPHTMQIVDGGIVEQTNRVFDNIEAILQAKGKSLKDIVRAEVYLKNLSDFQEMNKIYTNRMIGDPKPARHALEVARLPLDALVEISCIAVL